MKMGQETNKDYKALLKRFEEKVEIQFERIEKLQKAILVNSLYDEINQKNWATKLNSDLQVVIQYQYKDYSMDRILAMIMKRQKVIRPKELISSLQVYIKPEERMVYYVINGIESEDYRIALPDGLPEDYKEGV